MERILRESTPGLNHHACLDDIRFLVEMDNGFDGGLRDPFFRLGRFEVEAYSDDLFEKYSIEFPDTLRSSILKRRAEYLAGRLLAKRLLGAQGVDGSSITADARSCPLWPHGWVGSISHAHGLVACRIGPTSTYGGLGIDVERVFCRETFRQIQRQVFSQEEVSILIQSGLETTLAGTIVFSAKESIFKALYPAVGRLFDFKAAQLKIINTRSCFLVLKLTEHLSDRLLLGYKIVVRFAVLSDHVLTRTELLANT